MSEQEAWEKQRQRVRDLETLIHHYSAIGGRTESLEMELKIETDRYLKMTHPIFRLKFAKHKTNN